jgi:hypothetical protein
MAGYSGTPLLKKLGIKEGFVTFFLKPPAHFFDLLGELPAEVVCAKKPEKSKMDYIHLFSPDMKSFLRDFPALKMALKPDGMIWVSWPKKSSKQFVDLTEDRIRVVAIENGLVDVKVCAVDEDWSGLKIVIPVKPRGK